jgi:hypothetical protein
MPILRLAYTTQFLLALIAVFFVWEEVGGPYHLDLMPWWLKLGLGTGIAYAAVRATASAVAADSARNKTTLRWCAAMLVLLLGCVLANYYCNIYGEESDEQDASDVSIAAVPVSVAAPRAVEFVIPSRGRKGADFVTLYARR